MTPCTRMDDYMESVRRAGGEPIALSNHDEPATVLARVDGLLLTGGADVDPALYGQARHDSTETDPARDHFEIPLSQKAIDAGVPLFAICRGVQVLNVAAGGTLIQDLPSDIPSDLNHSIDVPKNAPAHEVRITAGTKLAESLGAAGTVTTCTVNSRHHQAVGEVAKPFVVSAVSPDGVIEGIERPGAEFCVGVQWHPENFWKTGEFAPLFLAFVEAARKRMTSQQD